MLQRRSLSMRTSVTRSKRHLITHRGQPASSATCMAYIRAIESRSLCVIILRYVFSYGRAGARPVSSQRNNSLTYDSIRIIGYFIAKCSPRSCPTCAQQWIFCYWACHLLGAVPVLVNAFVPAHVVSHCITLTTCKLIVLDAERSVRLTPHITKICTDSGATGVLVVVKKESDEKRGFLKSAFKEGKSWDDVMNDPKHTKIVASQSWKKEPECNFSDDGSIFFTSGTSVFFHIQSQICALKAKCSVLDSLRAS